MTDTPEHGQIRAALLADPRLADAPTALAQLICDYAVQLPTLFVDQLDQPVTVTGYIHARATFLRYILNNGFIERAHQLPASVLAITGNPEELKAAMEQMLSMVPSEDELMQAFAAQYIPANEALALQFQQHYPSLVEEARSGQLTYRDIILRYPGAIVINQ